MLKSELIQRISSQNPHLYQRDIEKIVSGVNSCIGVRARLMQVCH